MILPTETVTEPCAACAASLARAVAAEAALAALIEDRKAWNRRHQKAWYDREKAKREVKP